MPTIYKPKKNSSSRDNDRQRRERMKVYNSQRWRDLRAWKMVNSPLCEECEKKDRITPVDDVHHETSFMSTDDPAERLRLAYDYENLMSLCDECHAAKHKGKAI